MNAPGYSSKPLSAKLGIAEDSLVTTIGAPADYEEMVAPPKGVRVSSRLSRDANFMHVFSKSRADLARALARARKAMATDGVIWVSWPKKASVKTDVTEDTIRELAFPLDLVDIKVCAVSEVWSGLKLMIRKELRAK